MKEADTLIILLTLAILVVVGIMFIIYTFFIKKKGELLLKQQQDDLEFQKQLSLAEIEIKEQTLNYIGQELHDDLGQKLSVAKMMSSRTIQDINDPNYDISLEINKLLGECIQDIRNLSKTFITDDIIHFGLIDSLQKEMTRIEKLKLIKTSFHFNKKEININSGHGLILFRMIQESINNALKHSGARKLEVKLIDSQGKLTILITDNGKGFSRENSKNGSGLKNISNRAKLINAEYEINSIPGAGTRIKIEYKK